MIFILIISRSSGLSSPTALPYRSWALPSPFEGEPPWKGETALNNFLDKLRLAAAKERRKSLRFGGANEPRDSKKGQEIFGDRGSLAEKELELFH